MKIGIAVGDAGPLHYLALLGHFDLIGEVIERVIVPAAVRSELLHANTPEAVKLCIKNPNPWLTFSDALAVAPKELAHAGELETIEIAKNLGIKAVLMDDAEARKLARRANLVPIGTIGILEMASILNLIDLEAAFRQLQLTNAFIDPKLIAEAITRAKKRSGH